MSEEDDDVAAQDDRSGRDRRLGIARSDPGKGALTVVHARGAGAYGYFEAYGDAFTAAVSAHRHPGRERGPVLA